MRCGRLLSRATLNALFSAVLRSAGQPVQLGVQPSNCVITKLKIDKDRKSILDRKNRVADSKRISAVGVVPRFGGLAYVRRTVAPADKGKFTEHDVMGDVD